MVESAPKPLSNSHKSGCIRDESSRNGAKPGRNLVDPGQNLADIGPISVEIARREAKCGRSCQDDIGFERAAKSKTVSNVDFGPVSSCEQLENRRGRDLASLDPSRRTMLGKPASAQLRAWRSYADPGHQLSRGPEREAAQKRP